MGSSSHNGGLRPLVLSLVLLGLSAPARADFWYRDDPFEVASSNGRFVATVFSAKKELKRPTLELFKVEAGKRTWQSTIELVNKRAPHDVLITDDGQFVVTLDEFGQMGYGNEVVAIYSRAGLIKSYSLESFAEKERKTRNEELDSMFGRSTSSRYWRDGGIISLNGTGADARLGIWLPWAERWYIWKMADGSLQKLDNESLKKWNEIGLRWAHAKLEEAKEKNARADFQEALAACRFLGSARSAADRELLEKLLENEDAQMRTAADYSLAILDGGGWNPLERIQIGRLASLLRGDGPQRWRGHYRLGGVQLGVRIPQSPARNNETVDCYLFPESVKADEWGTTRPIFYECLDVFDRLHQGTLDIRINNLKPGKYWVKVVWDRTTLYKWKVHNAAELKTRLPAVGPEDFQTAGAEIFEIKAGKVIEVKLNCDEPGAKR
jgi:hypothetical protein